MKQLIIIALLFTVLTDQSHAQSEYFDDGVDGIVLGAGIVRSSAAYGYSLSFGHAEVDNFDVAVSFTSLTTSSSRKSKPIFVALTFLKVRHEYGGYGIGVGVTEDLNGNSNYSVAVIAYAYERLEISRSFVIIPKATYVPISSNMFRDRKLESLSKFSIEVTTLLPMISRHFRPFIGVQASRWEGGTISGINFGLITSFAS